MKSATISDLKNQLSKFLRFVKQGETVVVLDRGVAVAEIQPRTRKPTGDDDRLHILEEKGIIRRGDEKSLKKFQVPSEKGKTGILDTLLAERREGR